MKFILLNNVIKRFRRVIKKYLRKKKITKIKSDLFMEKCIFTLK